MGTKQSVYEKPGTLDYYKFTAEEYALVKNVWSGIEMNPQFHGNAYLRSFCETYPQYVKFFTLEAKLPVNFDARTTAKFSVIMETMGYLLLDFNNKPKRLDRFVGYIAMVHKDMRLDEQDMRNLVTSLFEYLSQTYPAQMTAQCREAMSKFMDSVIKQLSIKMEAFREYDAAQPDSATKSPWRLCPLFAEPTIFGKTKLYWDHWQKHWNERLDEWTLQATSSGILAPILPPDNEDAGIDVDYEDGTLQQQASSLKRRRISDLSASRLELLSLSKTGSPERSQSRVRRDISRDGRVVRRADEQRYQRRVFAQPPRKHPEAASAPRRRHRAKSIIGDAARQQGINVMALRGRLRNDRAAVERPTPVKVTPEVDDEEAMKRLERESSRIAAAAKPRSITARERRREHFKIHLKP